MKQILISIKPEWCEKIFNGEKKIEVRKSAPKLEPPFEALVYCTKRGRPLVWGTPCVYYVDERLTQTYGYSFAEAERIFDEVYNGKVIGSFVCDRIRQINLTVGIGSKECPILCGGDITASCLTYEQLEKYGKGKTLYGWHITEPKLFDEPKELSQFYIPCKWYEKGNGCSEDCALFDYIGAIDETDDFCQGKRPITRPPQSWCYIEYREQ